MSNEITVNQGMLVRTELDKQVSTAKAYPRNQEVFFKSIIEIVTQSKEVAQSCFYRTSRRSKGTVNEIEGPSIRLAEIVVFLWKNLHAGKRVIGNDGKFVTAEGFAWDLESNLKFTSQVQCSITNSDGIPYKDDMQAMKGNAAASIAFRNAVFTMVPKILIDPIWIKAKQFALRGKKDLAIRLEKTIDHFNKHGVSTERILNFFQKKSVEALDLNDIAEIFSTADAIKYKFLEVDKAFLLEEEREILTPDIEKDFKNSLN